MLLQYSLLTLGQKINSALWGSRWKTEQTTSISHLHSLHSTPTLLSCTAAKVLLHTGSCLAHARISSISTIMFLKLFALWFATWGGQKKIQLWEMCRCCSASFISSNLWIIHCPYQLRTQSVRQTQYNLHETACVFIRNGHYFKGMGNK